MRKVKTILLVAAILSVGGFGSFVVYRLHVEKNFTEQEKSTDRQTDTDTDIDQEDQTEEEQEYYGSSTYGECNGCSCGCVVGGCNGEICQSENEESMGSVCVVPNKPLPTDLGYSCKCINNQCQWAK